MSKYTIYHNPRCSKSRQTLALLREKDIEPQVIEYLKTAPNAHDLKAISKKLGLSAADMARTNEAVFSELGLADPSTSETQIFDAIAANPILLERPIVVLGDKAVIGRPPENVLALS